MWGRESKDYRETGASAGNIPEDAQEAWEDARRGGNPQDGYSRAPREVLRESKVSYLAWRFVFFYLYWTLRTFKAKYV